MWRRFVLLCFGTAAMLGLMPTSAFAHHAEVVATVDCNGLVSYTTTSWATPDEDHRINNSVTVSIGGTTVATTAFTAANGYSSSGTYQLPSPFPGSVSVDVAYGPFGASGEYGSAGSASSGVLTLPACPAIPGGSVGDVDCAAGGALATLTNTGGGTVSIRVLKDGVVVDTIDVGAGGTVTRLVPIAEDTTATLAIDAGGVVITSRDVHANCVLAPAIPGASIAEVSCVDGGALATLTNTGEATATFTVSSNGAPVGTVAVAGGATGTQLVPVAENTSASITVAAAGMTDVTRGVMRDCTPAAVPSASIGAVVCAEGGAFVTLVNSGGEYSTFTISRNETTFDTLVVGGGATATRLVPIGEDATAVIGVAAPLLTPVSVTVSRDCAPAPADAAGDDAPPVEAAPVEDAPAPTAVLGVDDAPVGESATLAAASSPDSLPFTGAELSRVLLLGLLLVVVGACIARIGRRPHREASRRG